MKLLTHKKNIMKTTASKKSTSAKKEDTKKGDVKAKSDAASGLTDFFEDGLKDIYWAEKALTKALPKMAKNATSPELVKALNSHLKETEVQITRLETIFKSIGKKAVGEKCDAMDGLIKEGESILEETESGMVRDAGIIAACQKVEHYEIATYGTLRQYAETLGLDEAEKLLAQTLAEEKEADVKLTVIAVKAVNLEAAELD